MTVARSPDRRVGGPRTACKHPRGDHPSPTGSCDPGLTWTNTLKRCTHGHLVMTCQARRPPRWAPRHVLLVCRPHWPPAQRHVTSIAMLNCDRRRKLSTASHSSRASQQPTLDTVDAAVRVCTRAQQSRSEPLSACPASTTITPYGSRPAEISTRCSAARAIKPLASPKGATTAISACAMAPTTIAGADVSRVSNSPRLFIRAAIAGSEPILPRSLSGTTPRATSACARASACAGATLIESRKGCQLGRQPERADLPSRRVAGQLGVCSGSCQEGLAQLFVGDLPQPAIPQHRIDGIGRRRDRGRHALDARKISQRV